jgi:hypothetical protein
MARGGSISRVGADAPAHDIERHVRCLENTLDSGWMVGALPFPRYFGPVGSARQDWRARRAAGPSET